jgi:3-hydroxymyristoyl/3-hydroxydecanoyl-(acyl carrier protein) dehydratase
MSGFVFDEVFAYKPPFGVATIEQILPHRYPFLLVDGMTEFREDGMRGFKNLSVNESFFQGHFPGHKVYPGVLQVETMAQVGACWILARRENIGKIAYLMSMESAKFRRPAEPGMRLDVNGVVRNLKSRTGRLEAEITCEGTVISSATILFAFQKDDRGSSS